MADYRFDTQVPLPSEYGDVEDYCVSGDNMADTPGVGEEGGYPGEEEEEMDVFAQLEQKEKDLRLAAELGKALLEKNEELEIKNGQIIEEFAQKMEVRPLSLVLLIKGLLLCHLAFPLFMYCIFIDFSFIILNTRFNQMRICFFISQLQKKNPRINENERLIIFDDFWSIVIYGLIKDKETL